MEMKFGLIDQDTDLGACGWHHGVLNLFNNGLHPFFDEWIEHLYHSFFARTQIVQVYERLLAVDRVERVARRLFMGIVLIAVLGLATLLVVTLWTGAWPK